MLSIKHILVGTDFSEPSDEALAYAVDLAERLGATITLVHAYEIPVYGFPDGFVIATAELASSISDAGSAGLKAAASRSARGAVTVTPVLRCGPIADEMNAVAEQVSADIIVIGTHGRHGLARMLLGSVADRMVRTATRPVLTIRAKPKAA